MNSITNKIYARMAALLVCLVCPSIAVANFFDASGEITNCNAFACGLADLSVGDPLGGFLEVDDAASGPDSTFTETDILSAQLIVGTLDSGVTNGPFGMTTLTTDSSGEISAGTAILTTTVDTGIGLADVDVVLDAGAGTWTASTDFFGLGVVASGTLMFTRRVGDGDADGITDDIDNCSTVANANQRDTDGDGVGNLCDPDVAAPNDCVVNFLDLNIYRANFFQAGDIDTDNNGDGLTNFLDLNIVRSFFFGPPGPSATGCN